MHALTKIGVSALTATLLICTAGCGKKEPAVERAASQNPDSPGVEVKSIPKDTNTIAQQSTPTQPPVRDQKDVTPDEVSSHRVLYQEGIDVTVEKDGKSTSERIAVYGVAGIRFPVGSLVVDQRAKLDPTIVTIEAADGRFLIPQAQSAVPVNMGFDQTAKFGLSFFTHAVNTTWKFVNPGIRFDAEDGTYEIERAGASISFTESGVKTDGVKKIAGKPARK